MLVLINQFGKTTPIAVNPDHVVWVEPLDSSLYVDVNGCSAYRASKVMLSTTYEQERYGDGSFGAPGEMYTLYINGSVLDVVKTLNAGN